MKKKDIQIGQKVFIQDGNFGSTCAKRPPDQVNGTIISEPFTDTPERRRPLWRVNIECRDGIVRNVPLHRIELKGKIMPWQKP